MKVNRRACRTPSLVVGFPRTPLRLAYGATINQRPLDAKPRYDSLLEIRCSAGMTLTGLRDMM